MIFRQFLKSQSTIKSYRRFKPGIALKKQFLATQFPCLIYYSITKPAPNTFSFD